MTPKTKTPSTSTTPIVAEATNPDAPTPTVAPEVFAGLSRAGYDSENTEVRTVELAQLAGDTKEASAAYAAGRLGAAFAPSDVTTAQAITIGKALLLLAGKDAEPPRCTEALAKLNHADNAVQLAALTMYFPDELAAGKKSVQMEKVYSLARAAWSKVLYRAGLRIKNAPAPTTTTNAAGLAVVTDAAEAKAAKETAAEKASATAEKVALDTPKAGATYLSVKAAELAVKIEKNPKAFTTEMRRLVLAFTTGLAAEMAKIEAAE